MFIIIRLLLRARLSWEFRDKTQLAPIIQTKLRLKNKGYKFTCRLRNQPISFTFFTKGKLRLQLLVHSKANVPGTSIHLRRNSRWSWRLS